MPSDDESATSVLSANEAAAKLVQFADESDIMDINNSSTEETSSPLSQVSQSPADSFAKGFAADNIPQWKKDLIQRRKTNISRTIGANQSVTYPKPDSESLQTTAPVPTPRNFRLSNNIENNVNAKKTDKSNQLQCSPSEIIAATYDMKTPAVKQQCEQTTPHLADLNLTGGHYTQVNSTSNSCLHPEQTQSQRPQYTSSTSTNSNKSEEENEQNHSNVKFRNSFAQHHEQELFSSSTSPSANTKVNPPPLSSPVSSSASSFSATVETAVTEPSITPTVGEKTLNNTTEKATNNSSMVINNTGNNSTDCSGIGDCYDNVKSGTCSTTYHQAPATTQPQLDFIADRGELQQQKPFQLHSSHEHDKKSTSLSVAVSAVVGSELLPNSKVESSLSPKTCSNTATVNHNNSSKSPSPTKNVTYAKNSFVGKTSSVKANKYKVNNANKATNLNSSINSVSVSSSKNQKMVAVQEINESITKEFDFDPSEELQYGPGIVSKLRCRYLSLALRQSSGKSRLPLDNLRRATSLNNLLDDDRDEDEDSQTGRQDEQKNSAFDCTNTNVKLNSENHHIIFSAATHTNTTLSSSLSGKNATKPDEIVATFQKNFQRSDKDKNQYNDQYSHRSPRQIKRGNDSLKRARSVEALLCDKSPWGIARPCSEIPKSSDSIEVTIEDKISNARERNEKVPKRLTSIIDDTERPPPDLVKQTLKMFEASANRRGRGPARNSSGEVATKIANYKSIISQEKPIVVFPKPPLSPRKSQQQLKKPTSLDMSNNAKKSQTAKTKKPVHPSSPISSIAKKFAGNEFSIDDTSAVQSSTPTSYNRSASLEVAFRQKSQSEITPIRNSSDNMSSSPRTPDVIPRKHVDKSQHILLSAKTSAVDSPVSELTKKIEHLTLESPITGINMEKLALESDDSLDGGDGDGTRLTKRVSKLALDNIAKAGTTQHFSFKNRTNKMGNGVQDNLVEQHQKQQQQSPTTGPTTPVTTKQIGVIRPLVAEPKLHQTKADHLNNSSDLNKSCPPSAINDLSVKIRENLIISNLKNQAIDNANNSVINNKVFLTNREIEKNFLNEKKSEQASHVQETAVGAGTGGYDKTAANTKTTDSVSVNSDSPMWMGTAGKKKSRTASAPSDDNTMIFNFSDRKEIPDYVENDGLVINRKRRELPKKNESGFVLLGDLSLETSTDVEEPWTMGPPSPCDVEFENANIIIDGKSSMRNRSKDTSLRVQFNDTLTSTFEYPSESSILEEFVYEHSVTNVDRVDSMDSPVASCSSSHHIPEEIIPLPSPRSLGNLSLGSTSLGSYTPIKAQLQSKFELGVTRAPTTIANNYQPVAGTSSSSSSSKDSFNVAADDESLQYLKPASDDLTVAYSEGIQKTDILF